MRKRQVKKFAKNGKKNMTPYREAMRGGSKKLDRRRRAFGRYWVGGLASWDQSRRDHQQLVQLRKEIEAGAGWETAGEKLLAMTERLAGMVVDVAS